MGFSWSEMVRHMGAPAIAVAVILSAMGLVSLTVFFERLITFRRSRAHSRRFAAVMAAPLQQAQFALVLEQAGKFAKHSYLARVVRAGITAYTHARDTRHVSPLSPVERTRRQLARYMEDVGEDLRRGMNALATVGSVAPFVGLLGTVLGIISAFQGIASTGSGGLASVSAGISEALIETAFGLAVAIPSVLGFNYLNGCVVREETMLNNAAGELLDLAETWSERDVADAVVEHRAARVPIGKRAPLETSLAAAEPA
ncbi:MAG: MotA/TolQ/ExbB proton channel family protein [Candidatus Binatia bacterium]